VAIRAVVFDIGSVLEIIDDTVFPGRWPAQLGMVEEEFGARLMPLAGEAALGKISEPELYAEWQRRLGLSDGQLVEIRADVWRWYVGTLDRPLFDWFAAVRGRNLKAGILSNSGPGAREAERHHGFEDITDDIVYSHEVGLKKPDPAIYALTERRLGVEPQEVVFLDDVTANVEAAQAAGWHAVLHESTPGSIAALERIIATGSS
jgi:epoxide hydrolase-like predicted phosphatase